MFPVRWIRQTASITWMSLQEIPERLGSALTALVGVAGVVIVLVGVLSIAEGFQATLERSGSPDVAIVLRSGAQTEMNSSLGRDDVRVIQDAPQIFHAEGEPVASAELLVIVDIAKRSTGTMANVPFRGVQEAAFRVRDGVEIVEGRRFSLGRREVVVGSGAAREFYGLDVGNALLWGQNEWTVVGRFEAGGTVADSEIWTDVGVLQPAYRRGASFQAVYARLESSESLDAFEATLTTDPRLDVAVHRESEYYAAQSQGLTTFIRVTGTLIALLMAVGAVFGALNTMYTAVAMRTREIATLRALGFRPGQVVFSVLAESLTLALAGGVVGGTLAYFAFDGFQAATLNWQSFSQVAFTFRITPRLVILGLLLALGIGFFGGLIPAVRAARMPVAAALREP